MFRARIASLLTHKTHKTQPPIQRLHRHWTLVCNRLRARSPQSTHLLRTLPPTMERLSPAEQASQTTMIPRPPGLVLHSRKELLISGRQ